VRAAGTQFPIIALPAARPTKDLTLLRWITSWPHRASNRILVIAVFLLHGPLDVSVTLAFWELESNPVVVELGPARWLLLKAVTLAGLWLAYYWAGEYRGLRPFLWLLLLVGGVFIVPNLLLVVL